MNKDVFNVLKIQHEFYLDNSEDQGSQLISIDLPEDQVYYLMLQAEVYGIPFNEYLNNILREAIDVL